MDDKHDLNALAAALAEAAKNLKTAKAENIGQVNAVFEKLGDDLLAAAVALGHQPKA